jgi:Domain of unknown function (DUF4349)
MTAAELTAQIRAAKPIASDGLRERVRALATAEPAPPFRVPRLRLPSLRIVLPLAAATAVAVAATIAFVRPQAQHQDTLSAVQSGGPVATTHAPTEGTPATGADAATPQSAPAFKSAAPVPTTGRATRYAAQLTITVKNGNALSDATTQAQATVRDLGGYVVSVSFASADAGIASLTLRVPTARVQDALTQLAALGRVVSQQAQIEDLQATLDQLDRRLTILRARIAHITALLTDTTLTSVRRSELEAQRTGLQSALRRAHQTRSGTANDARYATIQLQLQAAAKAIAPPPSRANRILHQAGRILAWEGAGALYALVIAGPFALLGAALAFTARARRRGEESRLLARS